MRFLTFPMLRVLDAVPHGSALLDIGAGHGAFAALAHTRGARRVVAVEPDARKVRPIDGIESVIGFDDVIGGTFDAISIIDVLYKIPTTSGTRSSHAAARASPTTAFSSSRNRTRPRA